MERNRIDMVMLVTTLLLVGIGAVMIYSASFVVAEEMFNGDSSFFLKRHVVRASLGICLLVLFIHLDYRNLRRFSLLLLGIGLVLLLLLFVPGLGLAIRGATRTLKILVSFQPAEYMKVALVIFLAHWLDKHQDVIKKFVPGLLPCLIITGIPFILIALQPDYGTALALGTTAAIMLFLGRVKKSHLLSVALTAIPFISATLYMSPHSRQRIMTYLERLFGDGQAIVQGPDYQLYQSLISLGTGGFFGTGLGQSRQKFLFLPDPHTDFVFAVIGEEIGFVGSAAVLSLFLILAWRGIRIARHSADTYGFFLASGLTALISLHVFINVGVVTGLLPTTGLPLPFISYGGSWLLFCMIAIGIMLNISRSTTRSRRMQYEFTGGE
ncbi:MAG: putative lipid II flippase FtsW [Gemmatimonadota bacterium]|nr:putative lipid II flippase FtsW [Gemmatimonadota bacterium]